MSIRSLALSLLVLATWSPAAAVAAGQAMERFYPVRVSVGADGVPTAAEPVGEVMAALQAPLRAAALASSFTPATKAGVAVPSRTAVLVAVSYEKAGRGVAARVTRVIGGTMPIAPPRYPTDALRRGASARVWLRIAFDADGTRDEARTGVDRVEGTHRRGRSGEPGVVPYEKAFRDAALSALADWTHAPEEVDGQPVAIDVRVPITFCARDCRLPPIDPAPSVTPVDPGIRLAALHAPSGPGTGS